MKLRLPNTLFGQLVIGQLLLFGVMTILLPTVLLVDLHRTADDFIADRLSADALLLSASLSRPTPPSQRELDDAMGPFYLGRWATRAYRVTDRAGHLMYQGGVTGTFGAVPAIRDGRTTFVHRGNLDLFEAGRKIGGTSYRITIAQDRTRPEVIVDDVVQSFLRRTVWLAPLIFLGSVLLSLFFLRRLTASMRRVARDADRIGPQSLDARLHAGQLPMEARSLVSATNRALDRVEQGYKRQASFVASVAHELRTPLALIALRSDLFPGGAERDALKRAVDQATHVVSQLMELAMLEGRCPSLGAVDLDRAARQAVEANAPLVYRSGRSIEVLTDVGPTLLVVGNEELLCIALTNLIDNAIRHTPQGTHIVVAAISNSIFVSDSGPGMQLEDEGEVVARYRSKERKRTDSAGLGLSIVQRIMMAMGGAMTIVPHAPGASIQLHLQIHDRADGGHHAAAPSDAPMDQVLADAVA